MEEEEAMRRKAKKPTSPFDALHLKSSNVQPLDNNEGDRKNSLIPDPNAEINAKTAAAAAAFLLPPSQPKDQIMSTASLPAKFHRQTESPVAGIDVKAGFVTVIFNYRPQSRKMFLYVDSAEELPETKRAGYTKIQVRMALLPDKKQRFQTKWASCRERQEKQQQSAGENAEGKDKLINDNDNDEDDSSSSAKPSFKETFTCRGIAPEDATNYGIRLRVYATTKLAGKKGEKLLGECIRSFAAVNLQDETTEKLVLDPRNVIGTGTLVVESYEEESRCNEAVPPSNGARSNGTADAIFSGFPTDYLVTDEPILESLQPDSLYFQYWLQNGTVDR